MIQPTASELRSWPTRSVVRSVGSTYWCKTGPDRWHRTMEMQGQGRSSAWIARNVKIEAFERSDVQMLTLLGEALAVIGGAR